MLSQPANEISIVLLSRIKVSMPEGKTFSIAPVSDSPRIISAPAL